MNDADYEKIKRELFCQIGMEFRMWYDEMNEQDKNDWETLNGRLPRMEGFIKSIEVIEEMEV